MNAFRILTREIRHIRETLHNRRADKVIHAAEAFEAAIEGGFV